MSKMEGEGCPIDHPIFSFKVSRVKNRLENRKLKQILSKKNSIFQLFKL